MDILLPPGWPRPSGYSNGVAARGRQVFVAGLIGWDKTGELVAEDLPGQFRKTLENTVEVLAEAGAGPEHVTRMTWYITDLDEYRASLKELGRHYREVFGQHYPAMAVIGVSGLVKPGTKVEIETTAVVPD